MLTLPALCWCWGTEISSGFPNIRCSRVPPTPT